MIHNTTDRPQQARFAHRLLPRSGPTRTITVDEQFEIYTDLATLLAASDEAGHDVKLG